MSRKDVLEKLSLIEKELEHAGRYDYEPSYAVGSRMRRDGTIYKYIDDLFGCNWEHTVCDTAVTYLYNSAIHSPGIILGRVAYFFYYPEVLFFLESDIFLFNNIEAGNTHNVKNHYWAELLKSMEAVKDKESLDFIIKNMDKIIAHTDIDFLSDDAMPYGYAIDIWTYFSYLGMHGIDD